MVILFERLILAICGYGDLELFDLKSVYLKDEGVQTYEINEVVRYGFG